MKAVESPRPRLPHLALYVVAVLGWMLFGLGLLLLINHAITSPVIFGKFGDLLSGLGLILAGLGLLVWRRSLERTS